MSYKADAFMADITRQTAAFRKSGKKEDCPKIRATAERHGLPLVEASRLVREAFTNTARLHSKAVQNA